MWVIKGLLFLALLFVLVYFFMSNLDQTVDIDLFGRQYLGIGIYWVVAICFLAGFAAAFVFAAVREFRFHRELARLRGRLRDRDREIADLRTLPLRDAEAEGSLPAPAEDDDRG